MDTCKTVVIAGHQRIEIREFPMPEPGPGQVVVRSMACALCTFEQRAYLGISKLGFPVIGGHEWAGIVTRTGPGVTQLKEGDHVTMDRGCGKCWFCRRGMTGQCENLGLAPTPVPVPPDGGYRFVSAGLSQYMLMDAGEVMQISPQVPFHLACLNEPVSDVVHSVNRAELELGDTAVVLGAGFMGLGHLQLARRRGARVILLEVDESRRKLAEKLGADLTCNPTQTDPVAFVRAATDGRGADVVFNCTAVPALWDTALQLVRKRGKIMAYSSMHPDDPIGVRMGDLHTREIEIRGVVKTSGQENYVASRLIRHGLIDLDPMIAAVLPFSQAEEAFRLATRPNTYRVILDMSQEV